MKIVFVIILFIHGLIHFMGFAKAFGYGNMTEFSNEISKLMGLLWLLTGLLFIVSAVLNLIKKDTWSIIAIIAVVVSQFLIITVWSDAKFGTIANIIILLIGISAFGDHQFNKMVKKETSQLVQDINTLNLATISEKDILYLPPIVQKWMHSSGVVGRTKVVLVRLRQKGKMKTKPQSKWMAFTATQYFDVGNAAFIWSTEVNFWPMIHMVGRDKLTDGQGEMLIKLASLIPAVDEGNNEKINASAMIRYMAEMIWFPSAALENYMSWEGIDSNTAKATFTYNGKSVSGVFKFSDTGEMISFEAERYYSKGKDATMEPWFVKTEAYKNFDGFKIPSKSSVVWKLKEGDFNWLDLEITDVEYNTNERYGF